MNKTNKRKFESCNEEMETCVQEEEHIPTKRQRVYHDAVVQSASDQNTKSQSSQVPVRNIYFHSNGKVFPNSTPSELLDGYRKFTGFLNQQNFTSGQVCAILKVQEQQLTRRFEELIKQGQHQQ